MTTALTFGRFRILQAGHIALIERMVREHDNVIVCVSASSAGQRTQELLRSRFPNVAVFTERTLFTSLDNHSADCVYLGSDRADLGVAIQRYHNVDVVLLSRPDDAPSSTRCRELYSQGARVDQFIEAGVAVDPAHALTIIAQCYLDRI